MVNIIKEPFNVQIYHPIMLPAFHTCFLQRLFCRPLRAVTVRIPVKYGFQLRFKVQLCYSLRYPVCYCWNAQLSLSAAYLGYGYLAYGLREITSARHPVPQLVQVAFQVGLECRQAFLVYAM